MAERNHRDLSWNGSDGQRFSAVPEELVEERKEDAGESPQSPRPESDGWEIRVVGDGDRERDLLNRRILVLIGDIGGLILLNCGCLTSGKLERRGGEIRVRKSSRILHKGVVIWWVSAVISSPSSTSINFWLLFSDAKINFKFWVFS